MHTAQVETNIRNANLGTAKAHLERLHKLKRDFLPYPRALAMRDGEMEIEIEGHQSGTPTFWENLGVSAPSESVIRRLPLTGHALRQLAQRLKIPVRYAVRMNEGHLNLLDTNVNYWLGEQPHDKPILVRTYMHENGEGVIRAVLSNRYRVIDNIGVLTAAVQAMTSLAHEGHSFDVRSVDVQDDKLFLKVNLPDTAKEFPELLDGYLPNGGAAASDKITAGFILTNGETGNASLKVVPRLEVEVCTNGMVVNKAKGQSVDWQLEKRHLGAAQESAIAYSRESIRKRNEAISERVKDHIRSYTDGSFFEQMITQMRRQRMTEIEGNPVKVLEEVSSELGTTEEERSGIFEAFFRGTDDSALGVTHAVTRAAQSFTAERQHEMEGAALPVVDGVFGLN